MENEFSLNKSRPAHFNAILSQLINHFKPLKIYLYAEVNKQELCNSVFATSAPAAQDIYYLLVITQGSTRIENGMQEFINGHYKEAIMLVLAHGGETLDKNTAYCNPFFSTIFNNGLLLYNADGVMYNSERPAVNPEKRLAEAVSQWYHRCDMAAGFKRSIDQIMEDGFYNVAVFLMHQVVEQACIGMIWVFMGYKSDMHNLKRLLYICGCFSKRPMQHFLANEADECLLGLLMKSYSAARYKDDFKVAEQDGKRLQQLTDGFLELAKQMCNKKFKEMEEAQQVLVAEQQSNLKLMEQQITTKKGAISND